MKTKRALFTTAGIIKLVISALIILIFGLSLLLTGFIKESFLNNYETVQEMVDQLIASDSSYAYLQELEHAQVIDIIMEPVISLCVALVVMGVSGIVFGIFNLIFAGKYNEMFLGSKRNKIIYTVCLLILNWGIVTNVLSLVGVWVKDEKGTVQSDKGC